MDDDDENFKEHEDGDEKLQKPYLSPELDSKFMGLAITQAERAVAVLSMRNAGCVIVSFLPDKVSSSCWQVISSGYSRELVRFGVCHAVTSAIIKWCGNGNTLPFTHPTIVYLTHPPRSVYQDLNIPFALADIGVSELVYGLTLAECEAMELNKTFGTCHEPALDQTIEKQTALSQRIVSSGPDHHFRLRALHQKQGNIINISTRKSVINVANNLQSFTNVKELNNETCHQTSVSTSLDSSSVTSPLLCLQMDEKEYRVLGDLPNLSKCLLSLVSEYNAKIFPLQHGQFFFRAGVPALWDFERLARAGKGGFGAYYRFREFQSGRVFGMKVLRSSGRTEEGQQRLLHEAAKLLVARSILANHSEWRGAIMSTNLIQRQFQAQTLVLSEWTDSMLDWSFNVNFLPRCHGVTLDSDSNAIYLIQDHIEGIDLYHLFEPDHRHEPVIPIHVMLQWLSDMIYSIWWLHEMLVTHGDVALRNFLVDRRSGKLYLIDLGKAEFHCQPVPHQEVEREILDKNDKNNYKKTWKEKKREKEEIETQRLDDAWLSLVSISRTCRTGAAFFDDVMKLRGEIGIMFRGRKDVPQFVRNMTDASQSFITIHELCRLLPPWLKRDHEDLFRQQEAQREKDINDRRQN